jgi:outer membrane protein assembly factor BamB
MFTHPDPFGMSLRFVLRRLAPVAWCLLGCRLLFAGDWPGFLGPTADGKSPETGLIESWPDAGPPVLWEKEIGTGYSAPSILGNRLVLHHRQGNEEIVECLSADTVEPLWRHAYPSRFIDPFGYNNGPRGTPLLTTNRCYTFGAEGVLLCLDLDTGERIWRRDTAKDWNIPEAFFGVGSSPILEAGRLLVMVGGQPDSGMVAFDPETGETLWESVGKKNWQGVPMTGWPGERTVNWIAHDKQASYATPVAAKINGRRQVLCLMRQGLVSLDPSDGGVNFSFWFRSRANNSVNAANPIVSGDRVIISAAYYRVGSVLLRVNADSSSVGEVWRDTVMEMHWATPILEDGHLYGFSGRNEPDARFRCVEWETGLLKWERDESWRRTTRTPDAYGRGSAILADGRLIVLGEGGLLGMFAVDPEKPVELARWQVPGLEYPCWAGPVLANGRLYLRSENRLVCLDLRSR